MCVLTQIQANMLQVITPSSQRGLDGAAVLILTYCSTTQIFRDGPCRPAREPALLQIAELEAVLPVLEERVLLVAPRAPEPEPACALRVLLLRARARAPGDAERLRGAVEPEPAEVECRVPERARVGTVAQQVQRQVVAVRAGRGVVGVRAEPDVRRGAAVRLLRRVERVCGAAGVGGEVERCGRPVLEAHHAVLPVADMVSELDVEDLEGEIGVEVEIECVEDPAVFLDEHDRRGRSAVPARVRLAHFGRDPRRLRRHVVYGRQEHLLRQAGDALERHGRRGRGEVNLGHDVLQVLGDVGRPPLLLRG